MFKRSGLSIAMGNASEDVKRQATAVTDSYDDEGFAKAVERFVLRLVGLQSSPRPRRARFSVRFRLDRAHGEALPSVRIP
jgi:hypothetical protein